MRGEVDAIAARLEKFRKVVSAAEEQLKNDKQCIRTDALRSPQRQRLVFLMHVQMSTASYIGRRCRAPCVPLSPVSPFLIRHRLPMTG